MKRINKIWFDGDWMYGRDEDGKEYRQSVLWYSRLRNATDAQRGDYTLSHDGMHWRSVNEDIGMDSFEQRDNIEPDTMQRFFLTHGELTVSGIARIIGIHPSLLFDYINGWKKPSARRVKQIEDGIRAYGRQLAEARLS